MKKLAVCTAVVGGVAGTVAYLNKYGLPVLGNLTMHLQPVYRKNNISLQCRCAPGYCLTEPDLFRSVLNNLLDNARKALDNGGNILILGERVKGYYRIRVFDNGRGMPEEAIKHITEAFYRVDKSRSRAQGGVGLGLALCERVARLHGTSLEFRSKVGAGTTVSVVMKTSRILEILNVWSLLYL